MSREQIYRGTGYSENLFQAIIEQSGEGISLANTDGNYVLVNKALCKMTGYSEEELLKMNISDLHPPETERILFSKALKNEAGTREIELVKKDGSYFWVEIRSYPIKLGEKRFALAITRDITELKQSNKLLKKSEESLLKEKEKLEKAISEIKKLSGLLPICSSCKKIRDDKGYWSQIETYIHEHSEAEFSHSICPECLKLHYPEYTSIKIDKE